MPIKVTWKCRTWYPQCRIFYFYIHCLDWQLIQNWMFHIYHQENCISITLSISKNMQLLFLPIKYWRNLSTWDNINSNGLTIYVFVPHAKKSIITSSKQEDSTKRYKMFHSRISLDTMVILICFIHMLPHSRGGSRNHVFLPLTIACHEGRCAASIYYSQKHVV